MKKTTGMTVCIVALLCAAQSLFAWEIKTDQKIGGASFYQEGADSTDAKWTGFFYEGVISIGYYPEEGIIGGVEVGIPVTADGREQWDHSGPVVVRNDMSIYGFETNAKLGWAFPTWLIGDVEFGWAPLVGYGYSFLRFDRKNFEITGPTPGTATASEDFSYHHLDVGAKIYWFATERIKVNFETMVGFIVHNTTDNGVYGSIKGGNGYLVKTEGGFDYIATDNITLNLDGFFSYTYFKGATSNNFTWPNSDLTTYGGKLGVKYIF